ncbi:MULTISPECIES: non-homologous end-joining DNA ligase [unclassified Streptomyces]|uniref:non-homologous end-joining DNA ligase n=2 Tax=Streptomyces TaxID=1883 RepID=UPI000BEF6D6D|nr:MULTISPECIES: non-homologous end-joining DNA ligase [unclassified Streptomyces]MBV7249221.1 non-homologous end-joining DNA ligase [Streptomyces sp. MW-W600-10]
MLATPGTLPSAAVEDGWAFEVKQDGQRAMIYLPGDGTMLVRARSGTDITSAYPEFFPLATFLGGQPAVLDGEIVALDEQGRSDFERLQQRMGLSASPAKAARMASLVPAHAMIFDVVHLGGRLLTRLPYTERRNLLEDLGLDGPAWSTPAAITGHGAQAWEMARDAGLEGLLAKRITSPYEPGARSKYWLKIKVHRLADVVIGGWVPGRGRLTGLPGAVLVGERHDGQLHYAGSVGTGWSQAERTHLAELLHVAAIDTCPFADVPPVTGAQWVLPRLVGEVRYTSRTRAGRLRHPSWHRLRPDLAPADIT